MRPGALEVVKDLLLIFGLIASPIFVMFIILVLSGLTLTPIEYLTIFTFTAGFSGGIFNWFRNQRIQAFNKIEERWWEWCKIMMEKPEMFSKNVDLGDNTSDAYQRHALCSMINAIFQQAYVLHLGVGGISTRSQWREWESYIRSYFFTSSLDPFTKSFQEFWESEKSVPEGRGKSYDRGFSTFIYSIMEEREAEEKKRRRLEAP